MNLMNWLLMDHSPAQNFDSSIFNLKGGLSCLKLLMDDAKESFSNNFDSTFVNLKKGSAQFKFFLTINSFHLN